MLHQFRQLSDLHNPIACLTFHWLSASTSGRPEIIGYFDCLISLISSSLNDLLFGNKRQLTCKSLSFTMASLTDLTTRHLKAKQTKQIIHLLQARSQKRKVNDLPKPVGKILECLSLKLQCSLLHLFLSNTEGNVLLIDTKSTKIPQILARRPPLTIPYSM